MNDDARRGAHIHVDEYPGTLRLLAALLGRHPGVGYEATETGAFVDWDRLTGPSSPLSSTEIAAVHIACGCGIAERAGGLPLRVHQAVAELVAQVTNPGPRRPAS